MKNLATLLCILNILSILWSVIGVFKKKEYEGLQYRVVETTTVTLWGLMLYFAVASPVSFLNYLILSCFQLFCLFGFWSHVNLVRKHEFSFAFSADVPGSLVKTGLYRYVRNPFYLIYLTCYGSAALCLAQPILMGLTLVMIFIYTKAARYEENKFLKSSFKLEYQEYLKSTGRFFPKLLK